MPTDFSDLVARRRSIRAYLDTPVDRSTLERICSTARQAPSGANLQPGKFHVLSGSELEALKDVLARAQAENLPIDSEYSYFPTQMSESLKNRQRNAGYALYNALGIDRRDVAGRRAQFARNYAFFDAPVGVVVTIDRDMGKGCFMDLGMAIMNFLLAIEAEGLGGTGIGALANYASVVQRQLGLSNDEMVVCGIAVGHVDKEAPENQFRTERDELTEYTSFRGFDE